MEETKDDLVELVFSCQVSGVVWFVIALQRPGAGFVPGLVVVFVRSMG